MPYSTFDILTNPLRGANLIEASAGTGKTYSLVMSMLRLILEKEMNLPDILMVTFTNAAVAELEIRVREVIQQAQQYSTLSDKDHIRIIVEGAIKNKGLTEIKNRLKRASLHLDELSIFTIHGFCQRVLQQYAFETKQVFDIELLRPEQMKTIQEMIIDQYWREEFISLDRADFELITRDKFINKENIQQVVSAIQSEKEVYPSFYKKGSSIADLIKMFRKDHGNLYQLLEKEKINYLQELRAANSQINYTGKANPSRFEPFLDDVEGYFNVFFSVGVSSYLKSIQKDRPDLIQQIERIKHYINQIEEAEFDLIKSIFATCAHQIRDRIVDHKKEKGLLNFDDLIVNVHDEIKNKNNSALIQLIRRNYKVAFVDEFQDTDLLQFDIFNCLFQQSDQHILFYVGDPKQSIYSFRKADINTYFKARESGVQTFQMGCNFRSSFAFVKAHNDFFTPYENFDGFLYNNDTTTLMFNRVDHAENNTGVFVDKIGQIKDQSGILLLDRNEKDSPEQISQLIMRLLDPNKSMISDDSGQRAIKASDICILFRSYKGSKEIKDQLSQLGIKAILYKDLTVFQSQSARDILCIMKAIEDPTHSRIREVMITDIMSYPTQTITHVDESPLLQFLFQLKRLWEQKGIFYVLRYLTDELSLRSRATDLNDSFSERHLSDFLQIMEIIQKKQKRMKWSAADLIRWFDKQIKEKEASEEDEDVQRLESEEDAVSMMTIHKSKGLEFPIVICEEFKSHIMNRKNSFSSIYEEGQYYFHNNKLMSEEQKDRLRRDNDREDRRLLYVAITRAKYLCCLFKNTSKDKNSPVLFSQLIQHFQDHPAKHIDIQSVDIFKNETYRPRVSHNTYQKKSIPKLQLIEKNWDKLSYSSIVAGVESIKTKKDHGLNSDTIYDRYIFTTLTKGANTGNLLHYLFENSSFSISDQWSHTIHKALNRYKKEKEKHAPPLRMMLDHVTSAHLYDGQRTFKLSDISDHKVLAEMEFNIPLRPVKMNAIAKLGTDDYPFRIGKKGEWEGLLNGFIDLFFEYESRYYILDWKSNHLGNRIEDYDQESVHRAMSESNYHLQYHIYTLALIRYLSDRLPSFDYQTQFGGAFYLFVRGIRSEQRTGIFHHKPDESIIQKMLEMMV